MKIVKLNRRFKKFKSNGHTIGLRFNSWSKDAAKIEDLMRDRMGTQYSWSTDRTATWSAYFGFAKGTGPKPYWITFQDESLLSLILLSGFAEQADSL